jgi:hypothetical protein
MKLKIFVKILYSLLITCFGITFSLIWLYEVTNDDFFGMYCNYQQPEENCIPKEYIPGLKTFFYSIFGIIFHWITFLHLKIIWRDKYETN